MIQYDQIKPYFELISKIIWEMPFGGMKYTLKNELTNLEGYCGTDPDLFLPNMLDKANHSIKGCFHHRQDISSEDLTNYVSKLMELAEYYEVEELNKAITGLRNYL